MLEGLAEHLAALFGKLVALLVANQRKLLEALLEAVSGVDVVRGQVGQHGVGS